MASLLTELRQSIAQLLKRPGLALVAVLTLGIGVSACATMFSLVNAVLLEPLPLPESERLVWIENDGDGGLSTRTTRVDNFLYWQEHNQSFESLGAYFAFFDFMRPVLTSPGEPANLRSVGVSRNFLETLGVQPQLGRNFTAEEAEWNAPPAAILTHEFWMSRFNADPSVIGRVLVIDGEPTEVVGVLPEKFDFDATFAPGDDVDLLTPFPLVDETIPWGNTLFAVGRLKEGVSIAQARAEFDALTSRVLADNPERSKFGARLMPLDEHVRGDFRQALFMLGGAVLCLLLVVCVNLSNLLLARTKEREAEYALRMALGASRLGLVRLAMLESLVLSITGSALGIFLAALAINSVQELQLFGIPLLQMARMNLDVLLFTLLLTGMSALICGIFPALQLWRGDTRTVLASGSRGTAGTAMAKLRKVLVAAEIALACMLLIAAALLMQSLNDVLSRDLGFEPDNLIAWRIDADRDFDDQSAKTAYYRDLLDSVSAVPGVESAGLSDSLPMGRNRNWNVAARAAEFADETSASATPRIVDGNYLRTLGVPLRSGRYIDSRDSRGTQAVVVINETMAASLWPQRNDVLGETVQIFGADGPVLTVVGVVADIPAALEEAPRAEMYLHFEQLPDWGSMELLVRSELPPATLVPAVRSAISERAPGLPTDEFITLDQRLANAVAPRRFITLALGSFSAVTLLLAAIGLYGICAWSVRQRTREFGVRLATGATTADIYRLVFGDAFRIAAWGVAFGLLAAFLASGLLESLLFGISATDPAVFAATAAFALLVVFASVVAPARRATRTDPMVALRHE